MNVKEEDLLSLLTSARGYCLLPYIQVVTNIASMRYFALSYSDGMVEPTDPIEFWVGLGINLFSNLVDYNDHFCN